MPSNLSPSDRALWASVPWNVVTAADPTTLLGWRKRCVRYVPGGASLQSLHVWIPSRHHQTPGPPDPASLPSPGNDGKKCHWVVYIHGGVWRDPLITADAFTPAVNHLLLRQPGSLAGLASLNYRLSRHPSLPIEPDDEDDARSRTARHSDHIADVLCGLAFLKRLARSVSESASFVLVGHSAGATMAFQSVMDPERWGLRLTGSGGGPLAVIGLNGLYDLASFVADPPASHAWLRAMYEEFTRGAFGDDRATWRAVCPVSASGGWPGEWRTDDERKKLVVLVQSREDTLVPYEQTRAMRARLEREAVEVREMGAGGDHNDVWETGGRLAEIVEEVLGLV